MVSLLLHPFHPALHQLDLDASLLDVLVFRPERPREPLDLFAQLCHLPFGLNVDGRGCFDLLDAQNPRCGSCDCKSIVSLHFLIFGQQRCRNLLLIMFSASMASGSNVLASCTIDAR